MYIFTLLSLSFRNSTKEKTRQQRFPRAVRNPAPITCCSDNMMLLLLAAKCHTEKPALAQTAVCLSRPIWWTRISPLLQPELAQTSYCIPETYQRGKRGRSLWKQKQHFFTQALPCCASHFPYNILSCIKDIYLIAVTELWEKAF